MTNTRNIIDNNRTRSRQEQDNNIIPGEDYNYYNNYPARARAREDTEPSELPGAEVMDQIAAAYRANVSRMITQAAAGIIERALRSGMEPATVIMAIEETGLASRPSPYYLSAVLRNWAENGVILCRARNNHVGTTEARPWWM